MVRRYALLRVGKNALALLFGRIGVLLLGLWLNGQLTRTVGVAGLGRYLLALTVEGITLAVANAGLNIYATREFSRVKDDAAASLLGVVLILKVLLALTGIFMINGLVAPWFFPGPRRLVIAWASLGLLPQAINGGLEALLKGRQRMELSSMIELTARFAAVLGGLAWLAQGGDERHVLVCYVVGHLLATVALGGVLVRWGVVPRWRGWRKRAAKVLGEAIPFAGVDLVAILYRRMDLLLLSYWHGDGVVGIYGAAYRLWETLGLLPSSFLDALFPELARRTVTPTGRMQLRRLYRRGVPLLLLLILVVGGTGFWLAPQLMVLLYGGVAGVDVATHLFRTLILALPFTYLYLFNGHLLYATGEQGRVLVTMAAVTVGNGLLNALLIPRWSYWGAAIVALAAEAALLLALSSLARRWVFSRIAVEGAAG